MSWPFYCFSSTLSQLRISLYIVFHQATLCLVSLSGSDFFSNNVTRTFLSASNMCYLARQSNVLISSHLQVHTGDYLTGKQYINSENVVLLNNQFWNRYLHPLDLLVTQTHIFLEKRSLCNCWMYSFSWKTFSSVNAALFQKALCSYIANISNIDVSICFSKKYFSCSSNWSWKVLNFSKCRYLLIVRSSFTTRFTKKQEKQVSCLFYSMKVVLNFWSTTTIYV